MGLLWKLRSWRSESGWCCCTYCVACNWEWSNLLVFFGASGSFRLSPSCIGSSLQFSCCGWESLMYSRMVRCRFFWLPPCCSACCAPWCCSCRSPLSSSVGSWLSRTSLSRVGFGMWLCSLIRSVAWTFLLFSPSLGGLSSAGSCQSCSSFLSRGS